MGVTAGTAGTARWRPRAPQAHPAEQRPAIARARKKTSGCAHGAGENEARLNHNQRAYWMVIISNRWCVGRSMGCDWPHVVEDLTSVWWWCGGASCARRPLRLSLRLELLGALITFGAALFAVLGKERGIDPCT